MCTVYTLVHSLKILHILKFGDMIHFQNAMFMFDFHFGNLPSIFDGFFKNVTEFHQYKTRLAAKKALYIPKIRTNYGKFNIRYSGTKTWNSIDNNLKSNKFRFKSLLKESLLESYG